MTNWNKVRKKDAELRSTADNASEALALLRWENTLGASPKVSFTEYARQCAVTVARVQQYARGWEIYLSEIHRVDEFGQANPMLIGEAIMRASTSVERADVIDVVAKAKGVTAKTVQAHHGDEVRRVETFARERAEKHGTTVRDEAKKLVDITQRSRSANAAVQERRNEMTDFGWLELDSALNKARRALGAALSINVVGLTDEHKELLADSLSKVRAVLGLVQMKFLDAADVDWDTELDKLTKGAN